MGWKTCSLCFAVLWLPSSALLFREGERIDKPKPPHHWLPDLSTATLNDLSTGLSVGHFSAEALVKAYEKRIEEVSDVLHAVLEVNHYALSDAREIDKRRRKGETLPALAGSAHSPSAALTSDTLAVPILVKDTVGTARPDIYAMSTTGGSFALLDTYLHEDSTVVAKLREAGAIILGKTNVSQCRLWLHLCGWMKDPPNGWSSRGGQTYGAFHEHQDPGGSSSGSAVSVAVGLAVAAIATETDASIISPARRAALCGIKPTVGLVSRAGIIPFSSTQDTVGPIARRCQDAAKVLNIIAGPDDRDQRTEDIPFETMPDYAAACRYDGLIGARLGVPTSYFDAERLPAEFKAFAPYEMDAFERAIPVLEGLGATISRSDFPETERLLQRHHNETIVLSAEMPAAFAAYLHKLSANPHKFRSLQDYLGWTEHSEDWPQGMAHASLKEALATADFHDLASVEYSNALESNLYVGGRGGVLGALDAYDLDAVIMPSTLSPGVAALAGLPVITVPSGWTPPDVEVEYNAAHTLVTRGPLLPLGISFVGRRFSEEKLFAYACAFEHATKFREQVDPRVLPETQLDSVIWKRASDEL